MELKKTKLTGEQWSLLLMIIPLIALTISFSYVPLFGWIYAFFNYMPGASLFQSDFVGFDKFVQIFSGGEIYPILRNTLVMSGLAIISTPLPAILALFINEIRSKFIRKIIQTTTTFPNFISYILVFSLFFAIFSSEGVYTHLLKALGLPVNPLGVLGDVNSVWVFQWFVVIWKTLGWSSIIYLAAIAGIDTELYNAAAIDGAGRFKQIIYVTIPGLFSTFMVLFLLQISNILNNGFDQYYVFYNALVADHIEVLDYYIYKIGILTNDYSQSIAIGILKTLLGISLLFTANSVSKKIRGESIF